MYLLIAWILLSSSFGLESSDGKGGAQNKATPADPGQKQSDSTKPSATQKRAESNYGTLQVEQKKLVDDYVRRYNATTSTKISPQEAYDSARMSIRTTFDAVTHALLRARLTDATGKDLGSSIDLVSGIDEIMGEEAGAGGDRQFRLYVYLKPSAIDVLTKSTQFIHDRDNESYHKGFPTCYRLKDGPPSIQFSISRDNKMADVDVDYRSSSFPKAVFNGHLTASNSDVRAGDNLQRHDQRWEGLDGWWREVFGLLGSGSKPPKEEAVQRRSPIPLNTPLKADQALTRARTIF
jgi:hypothetical protein